MLKIAAILLCLIGCLGLLGGEWFTSYTGILAIVDWLLLLASLGALGISFTIKRMGRKYSGWSAFFCALIFLIQFTWCGVFGCVCAFIASILIMLTPDQHFSNNISFFIDPQD